MLQGLVRARPLLWLLVQREFRARYAGSTLGVLWNLIHPVVLVAVYVVVFSRIMGAKLGGGTGAYVVHLCAGIVPWLFFQEVLTRSTAALVDNASFLKKMAVPDEILYLGVFVTSLMTHLVSLTALAVLLGIFGDAGLLQSVARAIYAVPVMLALGALALGLGMVLSVMNLLVRDVGQMVGIGLQFAFWSLPIVYIPGALPELARRVIEYNPLLPFVSLVQRIFGSPDTVFQNDGYYIILILPFLAVLAGMTFLRNNKAEILDRL